MSEEYMHESERRGAVESKARKYTCTSTINTSILEISNYLLTTTTILADK